MIYSFPDLEKLSGVAKNTLLQWSHRGLLPPERDDACACCAMWFGEMTKRGLTVGQALDLYREGLHGEGSILVITADGPQWMGKDVYKRKLLAQFEDDPFFFAVSYPHWFVKANRDLANFRKVRKFRDKVGLPAPVEKELVAVH